MFYQCTEQPNSNDLSIVSFTCPNGTVYNADLNRCAPPPSGDQCQQGTTRSIRGINNGKSVVFTFFFFSF